MKCDLRRWEMLKTLHGQARRDAAIKWLTDAQQQCSYPAQIWIQNSLNRTLGGAVDERIKLLTWTLVTPKAEKVQAVKKKRRI